MRSLSRQALLTARGAHSAAVKGDHGTYTVLYAMIRAIADSGIPEGPLAEKILDAALVCIRPSARQALDNRTSNAMEPFCRSQFGER